MENDIGRRFVAPEARILIVDDDPVNLMIETSLLKATKLHIDTAESGKTTLLKVKEQHYDLILLDHMMPGMDGIETFQRMKEERLITGIPVLILTSNDQKGAKELYEACGFQDYLKKPITGYDLEDALIRWLPEEKIKRLEPSNQGKEKSFDKPVEEQLSQMIYLKKALSYSNQNVDLLYDNISFYLDAKPRYINQLEQAYRLDDVKSYMTTIHALKGSSMMIGAVEISSDAFELESECKQSNWNYIREHHEDFLMKYQQFCESVQKIMASMMLNTRRSQNTENSVKDCVYRILCAAKVWDMALVEEELVQLEEICDKMNLAPTMLSTKQQMLRAFEDFDFEQFTAAGNELLMESVQLQS